MYCRVTQAPFVARIRLSAVTIGWYHVGLNHRRFRMHKRNMRQSVQVNCSKTSTERNADAAYRISIEEGACDLAVIEALLESSRKGSQPVAVSSISWSSQNLKEQRCGWKPMLDQCQDSLHFWKSEVKCDNGSQLCKVFQYPFWVQFDEQHLSLQSKALHTMTVTSS